MKITALKDDLKLSLEKEFRIESIRASNMEWLLSRNLGLKIVPTWISLLLWDPKDTHSLHAELPGNQHVSAVAQVTMLRWRKCLLMLIKATKRVRKSINRGAVRHHPATLSALCERNQIVG